MCLGHESLDGPHLCGLAEQVFAALPWPCIVWRPEGGHAVMVNEAFRRTFGLGKARVGPRWLDAHLEPTGQAGEFLHRADTGITRRYRMTREVIDGPGGRLQAVFLMALPDEEQDIHDTGVSSFAALRPDVCLTRRESQVLDGIMEGKLNKVIAGELEISPKTVELHRANLMAKLQVHNVVELARAVLDATPVRLEEAAATP